MIVTHPNTFTAVTLAQVKSSQNQFEDALVSATTASATVLSTQDKVALSSTGTTAQPADTYSYLASNTKQSYTSNVQNIAGTKEPEKDTNRLDEAMQAILDRRTGLDREKLKKIEEEMERIAADENLSEEEKSKQIELLQAQKVELIKESTEKNEERQRNNQAEVHYS